jgi:hypothetical protein
VSYPAPPTYYLLTFCVVQHIFPFIQYLGVFPISPFLTSYPSSVLFCSFFFIACTFPSLAWTSSTHPDLLMFLFIPLFVSFSTPQVFLLRKPIAYALLNYITKVNVKEILFILKLPKIVITLSTAKLMKTARTGRIRWKIEYETFNTLKHLKGKQGILKQLLWKSYSKPFQISLSRYEIFYSKILAFCPDESLCETLPDILHLPLESPPLSELTSA